MPIAELSYLEFVSDIAKKVGRPLVTDDDVVVALMELGEDTPQAVLHMLAAKAEISPAEPA
jgi:hypothetical protein